MFSIRKPRLGLVSGAATVMLTALALSACTDNGSGSRDEGAAKTDVSATVPSSAGAPTADSTSGGSAPATTVPGKGTAGNGTAGKGAPPAVPGGSKSAVKGAPAKAPSGSGGAVTCEGSNTKVVAAPLNRPVNHMLLTVTNTGSKTCYLYKYPQLQFTGAQAVPPVIKDSVPQAVVTLDPGQSGFASVALSATDGSGTHGYTAKSLNVYFSGRSGSGSVGSGAHPSLPATGIYIDDSLSTTYWQQTMDLALAW